MQHELLDRLSDVQKKVDARHLFALKLTVPQIQIVGQTPTTMRRVGVVSGGIFEGERLSGQVLDGGSDWQSVRGDGSTLLDVRIVLKADDDALIAMTYKGVRHGPRDVLARIDKGEVVDATSYYFRIIATFETASEKHAWLNDIVAVGIGHRFADGPIYNLFEVL
jgi:hypothetical protein